MIKIVCHLYCLAFNALKHPAAKSYSSLSNLNVLLERPLGIQLGPWELPCLPVVEYSGIGTGTKLPQRVSFVETLTKILCDNIPDFWRLGQSYLSGKLLKEVCDETYANLSVQI